MQESLTHSFELSGVVLLADGIPGLPPNKSLKIDGAVTEARRQFKHVPRTVLPQWSQLRDSDIVAEAFIELLWSSFKFESVRASKENSNLRLGIIRVNRLLATTSELLPLVDTSTGTSLALPPLLLGCLRARPRTRSRSISHSRRSTQLISLAAFQRYPKICSLRFSPKYQMVLTATSCIFVTH